MAASQSPRVSVCIPTYMRPEFLRRAVRSVLCSSVQDFEIIVSDDGCDPAIEKMLGDMRDSRIRYFAHPQCGIAANWTNAVSRGSAPLCMKLDDDDYIQPTFLEKTCELMDRNPDVSIVFAGHMSLARSGGKTLFIDTNFFRDREIVDGFEYATAILLNKAHPVNQKSSGVFRRHLASQIDFFDKVTVDVFFTIAMAAMGDVGYIAEPLFVYCDHGRGNEGMGWRPLRMTLESLPRLFELPAIKSDPRWMTIKDEALRKMRLVVPMMYIGNHFHTEGFHTGWQTANRVAREFPLVRSNHFYWPLVVLLSLIPRSLYFRLFTVYSQSRWPKKVLNLLK